MLSESIKCDVHITTINRLIQYGLLYPIPIIVVVSRNFICMNLVLANPVKQIMRRMIGVYCTNILWEIHCSIDWCAEIRNVLCNLKLIGNHIWLTHS